MKKVLSLLALVIITQLASADSIPRPWKPAGADSTFPRSIIHTGEINALKASLAAGTNNALLVSMYNTALSAVPAGNTDLNDKRNRAYIAKNAAFFALLNVRPNAGGVTPLTIGEFNTLKTKVISILEQINPEVDTLSTASPSNYIQWQWSSKQIIDYVTAYDLLRGAGIDTPELLQARNAVRDFVGNLYHEATKTISGTNFFQGAKNNHALMSAGAIGMAAVVLSDLMDTLEKHKPLNWINAAMWNVHNVMWWDIRKQSVPGKFSGYAEGTYYMRYAFANLLPFFRSVGYYLPDTTVEYVYNDIPRMIRNPWYDTNYVRIYDWMQCIRMPDGRMPPLEDSYIYKTFPELAILRKPKYNWPLYLSSLDPAQGNTFESQLLDIYDMRANYIAANTPVQGFQDSLFKVFPEAGIAVWRTSWDSSATYFALTGKNGVALASSEAHNQADDGSFMMMVNGQLMALDPGYLSFEMRDSVAKAENHNMILVNGAGPEAGIPGKAFGAEAYIEKAFSSLVQNYAELQTSYLGASINRKVMHVRKKYFLLADHVNSNAFNTYQWLLHGYGLEGGNAATGTFTDMLSSGRAAWKYKNGGLFAHVSSNVGLQLTKRTDVHEYNYENPQNHTVLQASNTVPTGHAAFLTCLQPYSNLATDTIAVSHLSLSGTEVAVKISKGGYTDVMISKTDSVQTAYSKTATGLNNDISTDAQLTWASETGGNLADLFVYKATSLSVNSKSIFSSAKPVNLQYRQTGAKTFSGYCGDSGLVLFHTGEYPFMFNGEGIWTVSYNSATKVASVYFGKASAFSFVLDDSKLALNDQVSDKDFVTLYPNPANTLVRVSLKTNGADATVTVIDITGKEAILSKLHHGETEAIVDVSALQKGIYFVKVETANGVIPAVKKLLVN